MSTENRPDSYPENFKFEMPPQPPVERGSSAQLNAWADGRLAIYASLDAAMTRHILEAVRSLSELKLQVEEDVRQSIQTLGTERDDLQREVEGLRLEQIQLRDEIKQTQRELEEIRVRKQATEHESQTLLHEAETERERIQREVNRLTSQMDNLGQQMQAFLQQRFNQLWESFVETLATQGQPVPPAPQMFVNLSQPQKSAEVSPPEAPKSFTAEPVSAYPDMVFVDTPAETDDKEGLQPATFAPDPVSEPLVPVNISDTEPKQTKTERFDTSAEWAEPRTERVEVQPERPEPRTARVDSGTERVEKFRLPVDVFGDDAFEDSNALFNQPSVPANLEQPVVPFTLSEEEFDLEDFDDTPTPRVQGGSPIIRLDKFADNNQPQSNRAESTRHLSIVPPVEPEKPTVASIGEDSNRARMARTQAEQRIQRLLGRRENDEAQVQPQALSSTGTDAAKPAFPYGGDKSSVTPERNQSGPSPREKERDRAELEEIAQKLGFEVVTPPSFSAVRFGPGFKPRSSSPAPSSGGSHPVNPPETPENRASEETIFAAPSKPFPLPRPVDFGWTEEPYTPAPQANTKETTPTTPAPRIGEIGDDLAQQFRRPDATPPRDPNRRPDFAPPMNPPSQLRPEFAPPPMMPPEPMRRFPSFPLPPPPGGPNSERSTEGDVETKLTISNLQGLSLLMMEKVVRGLDGVHHVTVTDFRKGVLEMDVRHSPDVKLDQVLPALPDLKLMLVERGANSLEFLQER